MIGGYRVESLLGRGGMGVVYRAEQIQLGRPVALKLMAPEVAQDPGIRQRFIAESRLAAAIDHPNILPLYEAGIDAEVPFIAARLVEGIDLKELLVLEGPLAPERAVSIAGQVAAALDAAHARGLVHRDVKPGNVLVARDAGPGRTDHCYLTDFGLTKRIASGTGLTATGHFVGTLDYMAPEQMGGGTLDGRADQYALACLFFECLSGHVPFARESDVAAMWAHVNESPPALSAARPGLPPALDAVLARALAKEPGGRYESCGAFVAAARHHLGGAAPGPVGAAGSAQGPARGTSGAAGLARGPARGAPGAGAPGAATAPARLQAGSSPAELAQSLRAHVRASAGLMAAGVAGVLATVAVLLIALAIAVVFPDESLVGLVGTEAGLVSETLRQAVGFLLVGFTENESFQPESVRLAPALLVLVPIAACAGASFTQAGRMRGGSPRRRLLWGAATAVPFAIAMLICALGAGSVEFSVATKAEPSVGGSFFLALLWGGLGGAAGAWMAMRREGAAPALALPARARFALGLIGAALRPLALAFLVATAIGTGAWLYETARDGNDARGDERATTLALLDNGVYAVEHGVHAFALGLLVPFEIDTTSGTQVPLPSGDRSKLTGEASSDQEIRLLDYRRQMSAAVFIPLLLVLIALPVVAALLAGFEVARRRGADAGPAGAAWGALVGPVWALTGVLAIALTQKELFGRPQGDAVFVTMLLGGAALGALGGLLAAQRRRTGHAGHPGAASPVAAPVSPPPPMAPVGQPAPAPPPPTAPAGQPASPPPAATAPSPAPVEEPTRVAPPARDALTVLEPPSGAPTRQRPEGPHPPADAAQPPRRRPEGPHPPG